MFLLNEKKVKIQVEYAWRQIKCNVCMTFGRNSGECKKRTEAMEVERNKVIRANVKVSLS